MKKGIKMLLASVMFAMSVLPVAANEQTINVLDDDYPEADIVVNARIGERDNTIDNPDLPVGDPRWINVTLPTAVFFHSDWGGELADLISPVYRIHNNSYMGLAISVDDFYNLTNPEAMTYIEVLYLVVADNEVQLMDNDGTSVASDNLLVTMPGNGGTANDYEPSQVNFKFAGALETVPEAQISQPTFNLILTFESVGRYLPVAEELATFIDFQALHSEEALLSRPALWDLLSQAPNQHINRERDVDIAVTGVISGAGDGGGTPPPPPGETPPGETPPTLPQTSSQVINMTIAGLGMVIVGAIVAIKRETKKN